jgi:Trk-type K+ transport system membrane component
VISIGALNFSLGIASVIGAIVYPIIYIFFRLIRYGDAWLQRSQQPQERVIAMIVLAAIIGFICGSVVQP